MDTARPAVHERGEPLDIFLEAARTNLERPYPANRPGAASFYFEAGRSLPGGVLSDFPPGWNVAMVLALSDDPRAHRALVAWAAMPGAEPHLTYILQGMTSRPRAMYLDTAKAVLNNPALAGELNRAMAVGPSFGAALGHTAQVSLYAQALDLAVSLPTEEGRAFVRRIAEDHSGDAPNPRTLAALTCPAGSRRIEDEAQALASVRIMALAALADKAIWVRVGDDPRETPLVRQWAKRMARGPLDTSKPGWKAQMDWRQRRHYEQSTSGREVDTMPCASAD